MRLRAVAAAWLLLAELDTSASPSGSITVDERIEYYRIEGRTSVELAAQLERLGPGRALGCKRSTALTRWELDWNHGAEMRGGMCQLVALDVQVSVVITLPQWSPSPPVDRRLVATWRAFMARLREHEDVHRRHGLQAAQALQHAVAILPPQSDCRSLAKAVTSAGRQEIRRYARISRAYDVDTGYGVKQGVRL